IEYATTTSLSLTEGISIVAGWPVGVVQEPSTGQVFLWFVTDNWPVGIPVIVFIAIFYLWYTRGRDPKVPDTLIPEYEAPDAMSAAVLGTVLDERVDIKDISAAIIQLAVKGYIKIKEIEKKKIIGSSRDYELIKLKNADSNLLEYEKKIVDAIFGSNNSKKVSDLANKFYKNIDTIREKIYQQVVSDDFFPSSPDKVRSNYMIIFFFLIPLGIIIGAWMGSTVSAISIIGSGIIAMFLARIMPRKTKKGALAHQKILGFKWFLSVTERERIKFHNAPAKSPKEFELLLPYAMVLGVEKEWAAQFKDIYLTPPEWYEGNAGSAFGALYLTSALGSLSTNLNSSMTSRPASSGAGGGHSGFSSGGGFSGGGFGGGGGGRW
ncbi:MAG: DUF2207 domain-containing protein, partial [Patescibacteria group bacterium]|nr:DUF2207 domain-containing protein [Patescibacteria group bacterium]